MDRDYLEKRLSLSGKKAIVTGSSGGIGAAIAKSFARFGAFVTVLGRNEEKIQRTVCEIETIGGECDRFSFDVGSAEESERFFAAYEEKHGGLMLRESGYSRRLERRRAAEERKKQQEEKHD
ncbi:MAG: SDR family NAD(P)-dependent oxidoreductase [Lachnospiraceae bacterium]|nr:SDR family NAD(P)-dependent oxidoreductase [Lachnospiraceae bacterium]